MHLSSSGNCHWLSALVSLIRVSQEVNYLAPVTQTLSKPCYFARTESENSMTHKTENWRVFSTLSSGRAQELQSIGTMRRSEAVMRSDETDITRAAENSLPHDNILSQVQTFCSNNSHKHTKKIFTSLHSAQWSV